MSVSDKPSTLRAQMKHHEPIVCYAVKTDQAIVSFGECNNRIYTSNTTAMTVRAQSYMALPIVCLKQNQCSEQASKPNHVTCYAVKTKQIDMRTSDGTAHPLDGNDDKEPQAVCYSQPAAFMGGQGAKARSIAYCDDGTTPTIKSVMSGSNTVPDVVYPINRMGATGCDRTDGVCYALEGNTVDRNCSQNGKGWCENVCPALNTQDKHAVCYSVDGRNNCITPEVSGTLQAHMDGGWSINCTHPVLYEKYESSVD